MEAAQATQESSVNNHYLDHVVKVAESQDVEASEDIISGNGMKLLAKGARIDGRVKDRLLEHKLRKPLEECMKVCDSVTADAVAEVASKLLDTHAMLKVLYAGRHKPLQALMAAYAGSVPLQSLLTVYAKHRENKLEHVVGVALMTMGMAKRLTSYDEDLPRSMLMAGLFHDIGELYIAPAFLARGVKLTPDQWRHIAAHPIVSHKVLKDMKGVGKHAAQVVLNHHERGDGYGYPHGLSGDKVVLDAQILAVAEMLSGLLEAGRAPLTHADVALKLIPGEFHRGVIDLVSGARRECEEAEAAAAASAPPLDTHLSRVQRIATLPQRLEKAQGALAAEVAQTSDTFKGLLRQATQRLNAILRAFSSTGLDAHHPEDLLQRLSALGDPGLTLEFTLIIKEIVWRLKEVERELTVRVQMLAPRDAPVLARLVEGTKSAAA